MLDYIQSNLSQNHDPPTKMQGTHEFTAFLSPGHGWCEHNGPGPSCQRRGRLGQTKSTVDAPYTTPRVLAAAFFGAVFFFGTPFMGPGEHREKSTQSTGRKLCMSGPLKNA